MKRIVAIALLACMILSSGYLLFQILSRTTTADPTLAGAPLPAFSFADLSGATVTDNRLRNGRPSVVIHFLPDCHFCRYEVEALRSRLPELAFANVVLVSGAGKGEVAEFMRVYQLENVSGLHVWLDEAHSFPDLFGTGIVPAVFLYDTSARLIRCFRGETKMEAILSNLNSEKDGSTVQ